jgi:hypothetical protein
LAEKLSGKPHEAERVELMAEKLSGKPHKAEKIEPMG